MLLFGLDVGTSSIKASLLDAASGRAVASAVSPETELPIASPRAGWAEQDPETWWAHVREATRVVLSKGSVSAGDVGAVGISYQMHGLVLVGDRGEVLRPAILWCDGRAVETGRRAFEALGRTFCLSRLLNAPGNFTASKLAWVKAMEPDVFARTRKLLLPGDFIALRLTGRASTTPAGLSEGIFWDFEREAPSAEVLDHIGVEPEILPEVKPVFSVQGEVTKRAAEATGLRAGTPVAYRAGDQANNAFSLGVLAPGEAAATAGTSGVVYGVTDRRVFDPRSRVNAFVHVNHAADAPRYGLLLCVNGAGSLYRWMRLGLWTGAGAPTAYATMNERASRAPAGAEGLSVLPFGNGPERILEDRDPGASVHGLNVNLHDAGHLLRAAQEGIVFALDAGIDILRETGFSLRSVRAGRANLFLSPLFRRTFATVTGVPLELHDTDGSLGAARGAGVGAGIFGSLEEALAGLTRVETVEPDETEAKALREAKARWRAFLERTLS